MNTQTYKNLNALLESIKNDENGELDYSELPTFGGKEPKDTSGVFSWDEKGLLVQDEFGWRIVERNDQNL